MGFGNLVIDEGQELQINDDIDNMVSALKINGGKNAGSSARVADKNSTSNE